MVLLTEARPGFTPCQIHFSLPEFMDFVFLRSGKCKVWMFFGQVRFQKASVNGTKSSISGWQLPWNRLVVGYLHR